MTSPITAVRDIYRGWMSLLVATLRLADGAEVERHVMVNKAGVCVLPYDPERRTALVVSMLRAPVAYVGEPEMLESVVGAIEEGEDPVECARREALEEAGVALGTLDPVAQAWTMPGNSTERIDYFLAPYAADDRKGPGGGIPEEQEQIRVHELPLAELWRMVEARELRDAKLLTLLQALRIRRPGLFA